MEFLIDNQILDRIRKIVSNPKLQKKPLHIAVAYWGKNSIRETGLQERINQNPDNTKVICDIKSGACNPKPVEQLLKSGIGVKTGENMHAKVWVCGDEVIVGSANVSANGLGFDDKGSNLMNREAAVYIRNKEFAETVTTWFERTWKDSDCVHEEDIDWARKHWKLRRNSKVMQRVGRDSYLARVSQPRVQRKLYETVKVLVWQEEENPWPDRNIKKITDYVEGDDAERLYTREEWEHNENRDYWRCTNDRWKFRKGDIFLEFTYPPRGNKLRFRGVHRVASENNSHKKIGKEDYIVMYYKEADCNGYIVTGADQDKLKQMVELYKRSKKLKWEENSAGNLIDMNIRKFLNLRIFSG